MDFHDRVPTCVGKSRAGLQKKFRRIYQF